MATSQLSIILEDLGKILKIGNLAQDNPNTCTIKFEGNIAVQIEMDKDSNYLLIGTELPEIPPGRYRENLFEAALKNHHIPPCHGIFGYSKKNDRFVLFYRLWNRDLTGEKLFQFLKLFIAKAKIWKETIEKNDIPVQEELRSAQSAGFFGLRP